MKKAKIILAVAILGMTFTSCKKDYTCTCTTVVSGVGVDVRHSIDDATLVDAKKSCNNYEDQGNSGLPGSTTCHL